MVKSAEVVKDHLSNKSRTLSLIKSVMSLVKKSNLLSTLSAVKCFTRESGDVFWFSCLLNDTEQFIPLLLASVSVCLK